MKLEVIDGCFSYPNSEKQILKNINFSVESGRIVTILGKNGIGKTTLVKCMTGIYSWDKGCVAVDGRQMKSVRRLKSIAFVPQTHALSFPYSVRDIVIMGRAREMGPLSIPSKADTEAADRVIEEMGLEKIALRRCTELSGGQLQMVFIARALAGKPELLVMDEPESHLDFKNQYYILELIEDLARKRNISCIINTHYPDHALRISDETLLLGEGISEFGITSDILTEENISKYFEVRAKIADIEDSGKVYKTFVVLKA